MFRKYEEVAMYTTQLDVFKTRQQELHRRAAEYRLIKSLAKPAPLAARIARSLGQTLIASGQELIKESRLAL
jgi:hypothetical protein